MAEALLSVMETELELKIEEILDNKISDALDDYDLTDHPDFGDAVESTYAKGARSTRQRVGFDQHLTANTSQP